MMLKQEITHRSLPHYNAIDMANCTEIKESLSDNDLHHSEGFSKRIGASRLDQQRACLVPRHPLLFSRTTEEREENN